MKEEIERLTPITVEEKEIDWVKEQRFKKEKNLPEPEHRGAPPRAIRPKAGGSYISKPRIKRL
jgi:hypothetical protein